MLLYIYNQHSKLLDTSLVDRKLYG